MTPSNPNQIVAIDLVRFVCALLVVAHHYASMLPIAAPVWVGAVTLPRDWVGWSWAGWIGVELFFVVSGYVIAISAEHGAAGAFARRRALRLVPAAWICASITSAVALAAAILPWPVVLARWSASIVFDPFANQADPSSWTLGIEVSFYCLVALLLRRSGRPAVIEHIGTALALVSAVWWIARATGVVPAVGSLLLDLALVTHGSFFAIGIALWTIRAGITPQRASMLVLGLLGGMIEIADRASFMAAGLGVDAGAALPLLLFAGGVVIIMAAGSLQAPLARWIGANSLKTVGLATYPLYLIHQQSGFVAILWLTRRGMEPHVAMVATALLALSVAIAIARYAEPPLRRWLAARIDAFSRRGSRRDTPPSASLPAG